MSGNGGLLDEMARTSDARWRQAARREPLSALRRRAATVAAPPPLCRSHFDLIAEVKLRAPSTGQLGPPPSNLHAAVMQRARAYARAGAAAISVLTEPDRFDGDLYHLAAAANAVSVPVMRKDFLVHPYQVWEARAAGAGGVLLIARMLDDRQLHAMLDTTLRAGMFALVEAFDTLDLRRAARVAVGAIGPILLGVNTRDLVTLAVDRNRLNALVGELSRTAVAVAESGLSTPDDVAAAAAMGWDAALVGTGLMTAPCPAGRAREMLRRGRAARLLCRSR